MIARVGNVLNAMPKSVQATAKGHLHDIRKAATFATVRHRTVKAKGCISRKTGLAIAFNRMMSAQGKWRKLDGSNRMPEIIQGVAFVDVIKHNQTAA